MNMNFAHMWETMSVLNKAIFIGLFVMFLACAAIFVERMITLGRSVGASRRFAAAATKHIENWDSKALLKLADQHQASSLARLFKAIVTRYERGLADPDGGLTAIDMARHEAARKQEAVGAELRTGMSVLATIGSVSPFVGLLGTVIGIIAAFQGIAATGSGGLGAVSAGISEALIETAVGLMVAIPAVFQFNYLTGVVGSMELALSRSVGELLDEMEHNYGRDAAE